LIFLAGQAIATGISLQKSGPILFRSRQIRLLHPQRRVVVAPLGVVPAVPAVLAAQPRLMPVQQRMLAPPLLEPMQQLQQAEVQQAEVPVAVAMRVLVQRQQMTATAVR
jgi:hypothetical protein